LALADPEAAVALLRRLRDAFGDRLSAFEVMARICLDFVVRKRPRQPGSATRHDWYALVQLDDNAQGADLQAPLEDLLGAAPKPAWWSMPRSRNPARRRRRSGRCVRSVGSAAPEPVTRSSTTFHCRCRRPGFSAARGGGAAGGDARRAHRRFGHFGDGNVHYNLSSRHGNSGGNAMHSKPGSASANRIVLIWSPNTPAASAPVNTFGIHEVCEDQGPAVILTRSSVRSAVTSCSAGSSSSGPCRADAAVYSATRSCHDRFALALRL